MSDQQSETPPNEQSQPEGPSQGDSFETYQKVAETVGMVPSLRWKDSLVQLVCVLLCAGIGALIGWFSGAGMGVGIGVVAGLILGVVVSGCVLMVLGWVRASR